MNRLTKTTLALVLATLMSPVLALESAWPGSPDAGNRLLEREIDRLGMQDNPSSGSSPESASAERPSPQREVTLVASRKHKDRDYDHYRPSKSKHHYRRHDHRGHDHWERHDHGHIHYYRPSRYWGYDRYYDYYDGVNLNLILHLDG